MGEKKKKRMHKIVFIVSIHVGKSGQNSVTGTCFIISFNNYFWQLKSIIFLTFQNVLKMGIFLFLFHLFKELVITYSFFIRLSDKWMGCFWILTYGNNKTPKLLKYLFFFFYLSESVSISTQMEQKSFLRKTKIPLLTQARQWGGTNEASVEYKWNEQVGCWVFQDMKL